MKTLAILLALCSPAVAGHCRQNVVVHQQYAAPVVLQQVAPYAYWSVGSAVQEEAFAERMRRIIKQELAAQLKTQQAPAAPEKPLGLTVLQTNCAKCHKPDSKAVVEKTAPALFDALGNLTASQEQVGSILTTVRQGIMPPQPAEPLSDDDFTAIRAYLGTSPK
jgi:mono/diheme cytochrome c family protein